MGMPKKKQIKHRRQLEREEIVFDKRLIEIYKNAQYNILEKIRKLSDRQQLNIDNIYEYGRLDRLKQNLIKEFKVLDEKTKSVINKELLFMHEKSAHLTTYILSHEAGTHIAKRIISDEVVKKALNNKFDLVGWEGRLKTNLAKTIVKMQTELSTGLTIGEGYGKIANRIKKVIDVSTYEALRIARTEAGRIRAQADQDSIKYAEGLGLIIDEMWDSTIDGRTRQSHITADGQKKVDGYFTLSGNIKTVAPKMSGVASEDINCRCEIVTLYNGETPEFRRVRDKGIIPYQTFDEYLKSGNKVQ